MGFPRQEHWSGLPFPPPGDLLHPGIELTSITTSVLAGGFITASATWEAQQDGLGSSMLSMSLEDHRFHRIIYYKNFLIYTIIYYLHCLFLTFSDNSQIQSCLCFLKHQCLLSQLNPLNFKIPYVILKCCLDFSYILH